MKVYSCKSEGCRTSLFERRAVCPNCGGVEFGTKDVKHGISAITTVIRVNRNGNSDPVNLVYATADDGLRVLCRSTEALNSKVDITFIESEGSVSCSRKEKRLEKSV